jgi:site-specific recombinase XerD
MTSSLSLVEVQSNELVLMPEQPDKDEKSRLGYFIRWLDENNMRWYQPDLAAYRDYLLYERVKHSVRTGEVLTARLSTATVQAHLATIRGRYDSIMRNNNVREMLHELVPDGATLADRKAFVDEIITRLQNAVHPTSASVKEIIKQDYAESEYIRLKPNQVKALLLAPGLGTLLGTRDTAIMALLVCTGVREAELCDLQVSDLRQSLRDELALLIRRGKGRKQRLVPYGPLDWCLLYVDRWLKRARISGGPVFRGVYKGQHRVRRSGITPRSVNRIMNHYPIMIDGELRDVKPHDLRRTYARNAYEMDMDIERIRQNLGHTNAHTTQNYIGSLDAELRRPPDMFQPPHNFSDLKA